MTRSLGKSRDNLIPLRLTQSKIMFSGIISVVQNSADKTKTTQPQIKSTDSLTLLAPISQNAQTHANNSSANCRGIV